MRELSVTEQRYKAVLAVIAEGRTVTQVARDWNVARQTLHVWLEHYEAEGLEGLANRSHRPARCPHQMAPAVEVQLLEMRRAKPYWGARRLALERGRKGVEPAPTSIADRRARHRGRDANVVVSDDEDRPVVGLERPPLGDAPVVGIAIADKPDPGGMKSAADALDHV